MNHARGRRLAFKARRQEALILMGVWCGARMADTTRTKTGMRLQPQVGGGVCLTERNEKKLSKVVRGGVLSLDKSLLMGVFPIHMTLIESTPAGDPSADGERAGRATSQLSEEEEPK